jgi:hypothetical protein
MAAKLVEFFEFSDYDWTPQKSTGDPSIYLMQMVLWLRTVVDDMDLRDEYKDAMYQAAAQYIADRLMVSLRTDTYTNGCNLCMMFPMGIGYRIHQTDSRNIWSAKLWIN